MQNEEYFDKQYLHLFNMLSFLEDTTYFFSLSPNTFLYCWKNHVYEQSFSVSTIL